MKIAKLILILFLCGIASCGYKPIYSNKGSVNYSITEYDLKGDSIINKKIVSLVKSIDADNLTNSYTLELISDKSIETVSKDSEGNANIFRTTINVELSLMKDEKIIITKKFNSNFTYNNTKNKFDLSQYQMNVENNLIEKIGDEILIFLISKV